MLSSPYTEEARNGLVYIIFDSNATTSIVAEEKVESKLRVKKEVPVKEDGESDDEGKQAVLLSDDDEEVVFAEDQEYADDDDFAGNRFGDDDE